LFNLKKKDMNQVKPIPEGISMMMPRLICRDPLLLIDFCKTTFDAIEQGRRPGPDGTVAHALMMIGPAMFMIEAEWPTMTSRAPKLDGSSPVVIFVYVRNVDAVVEKAANAGATIMKPPEDQFWGDRTAWIMDPSGHVWTIATRIEEPTEEERKNRLAKIYASADSRNTNAKSDKKSGL
jgi:PhnB protein